MSDVEIYRLRRAKLTCRAIVILIAVLIAWYAYMYLGWELIQSALLVLMTIIVVFMII